MGGDPGKPSVGHQWETLIYFLPFVLLSFVHFFFLYSLKTTTKPTLMARYFSFGFVTTGNPSVVSVRQ